MPGAPFYDSTAVATALGVKPSAVTNWRKRGTGPLPEPAGFLRDRPYWTDAQVRAAAAAYASDLDRRASDAIARAAAEYALARDYLARLERIRRDESP